MNKEQAIKLMIGWLDSNIDDDTEVEFLFNVKTKLGTKSYRSTFKIGQQQEETPDVLDEL